MENVAPILNSYNFTLMLGTLCCISGPTELTHKLGLFLLPSTKRKRKPLVWVWDEPDGAGAEAGAQGRTWSRTGDESLLVGLQADVLAGEQLSLALDGRWILMLMVYRTRTTDVRSYYH